MAVVSAGHVILSLGIGDEEALRELALALAPVPLPLPLPMIA